jgi:hypothetical protein
MRTSIIAVMVVLIFVPTASAKPTRAAASRGQLSAYLAKVRPIGVRYTALVNQVNREIDKSLAGDSSGIDGMRSAAAKINALAPRMAKVSRPAELAGPHASFVRALRLHARMIRQMADAIEMDDLQGAADISDSMSGDVIDLIDHWNSELTYRLRRAGMTVPLWVKHLR